MTDFAMFRGDTATFRVTVKEVGSSDYMDLTGCTMYFTGKTKTTQSDDDAVFKKSSPSGGIDIDAGTGGTATITLEPSDTNTLTKKTKLFYDVSVTDAFSNVFTVQSGILTVNEDITREQ